MKIRRQVIKKSNIFSIDANANGGNGGDNNNIYGDGFHSQTDPSSSKDLTNDVINMKETEQYQ